MFDFLVCFLETSCFAVKAAYNECKIKHVANDATFQNKKILYEPAEQLYQRALDIGERVLASCFVMQRHEERDLFSTTS